MTDLLNGRPAGQFQKALVGTVKRVGQQAEPAESDFRIELLKRADRVEAEAEERSLAQRDGRVGIGDAEKDREVIDARAGVDVLHDLPIYARLVLELDCP